MKSKRIKHCKICDKIFYDDSKFNKRKYCSELCKIEGKKRKEQEYYEDNRLEILKKANDKIKFEQKQNDNIIRETLQNVGYLPEGFNQIDSPHDLGESRLREHCNPDFEKEQELVKKELKRLLNR